jgi:hypothetical protein
VSPLKEDRALGADVERLARDALASGELLARVDQALATAGPIRS